MIVRRYSLLSLAFLLAQISIAQISAKRDHRLSIAEIEMSEGQTVFGYVKTFSDTSVIITNDFTDATLSKSSSFTFTDIKKITYHRSGSVQNGYQNAAMPVYMLAITFAAQDLTYYGALYLAAAAIYTAIPASLVGVMDYVRRKKMVYVTEGDPELFKEHINKLNKWTVVASDEVKFTHRGLSWYSKVTNNRSYYPLNYKPSLHFISGSIIAGNFLSSDTNGLFLSEFRNSESRKFNRLGLFGFGLSLTERLEIGAHLMTSNYQSRNYRLIEGNAEYNYFVNFDNNQTVIYGLFHFLPYQPEKQPIQLSAGLGLVYNNVDYYADYSGILNGNFETGQFASQSLRIDQYSLNIMGRSELFITDKYSFLLQVDYFPLLKQEAEPLQLNPPFRTDQIIPIFNNSSLAFTTGIRFHY
ncbi:MAG: hypothetical protein ACI8QD_001157 [Cyclobacteriaceae bacterium]|jgi:hypothetical protein